MEIPGARTALALLVALAAAACRTPEGAPDVYALPRAEFERPVPSANRTADFFWPIGHREDRPGFDDFRLRPFWRTVRTDESEIHQVLYPLYRQERRDDSFRSRLFPIFWRDRIDRPEGSDIDTAVAPFLWWGSDPAEGSYFLFFPFGGTVRRKFFVEEGTFVLFPLYLGTRTGGYSGTHLLWPLAHFGEGDGLRVRRFYPFYAEARKEGKWEEFAAPWPFVQWGSSGWGTPAAESHWAVWPLYGERDGVETRARTVLWPFFQWADGPRQSALDLPFPFFRRRDTFGADGAPESSLRWWWPLHGRFDGPGDRSRFWLWPIAMSDESWSSGRRQGGFHLNPFWASRWSGPADGSTPPHRWWKLWPLAKGDVRPDGGTDWSVLSPIPIVRWEEFDANWGVYFELLRRRSDPDGSTATDLLFSLVRRRTSPEGERHRVPLLWSVERGKEGSSWKLLEGLLGGETDAGGGSSLRLLWFLRIPAR
jgi:hypothetical protein